MEFEKVTPESVGVESAAVLSLLDELKAKGSEMHSIMLLRHGKVFAQGWWKPYSPEIPHIMFSFSKSLTSTAIGFAEQEGILSLDERLCEIFPDRLPENPSENLKAATVKDLLMMACGHETESEDFGSTEWIDHFFAHEFKFKPGTMFHYNTVGTNMLCAVLKKKTGEDVTEFLRPRLFEPLGMGDIRCYKLDDGIEMGGAGMRLRTEDMARFIQFVSNEGKWEEKQLLNADWFRRATSKQIETDNETGNWKNDWGVGYGFQFWRCTPPNTFRGDGAFGQYGIVLKDYDMIVITTSCSMVLQDVLTAIWEKLLPGVHKEAIGEVHMEEHILRNRLKNLELATFIGMRNPEAESSLKNVIFEAPAETSSFADIVGGSGIMEEFGGELKSLSFEFMKSAAILRLNESDGAHEIETGLDSTFHTSVVNGRYFAAIGRWRKQNVFEAEIRNLNAVSGKRLFFTFSENGMVISAESTMPVSGGLGEDEFREIPFTMDKDSISTQTKQYWQA